MLCGLAPKGGEESYAIDDLQEDQEMKIDIQALDKALTECAAFRRISRLQPVGGKGDKIFPPTYPGRRREDPPQHVMEKRQIDGQEIWCVLVDSVQSQANRLEEALLAAVTDGEEQSRVSIPYVTVDFRGKGLEPLEQITSLDAPHRVYDAILRDSLLDGVPFMQSETGRGLAAAKPLDSTALLEISPTALVFGAWHSQGEGGGLGAKFSRTLISEIMAINTPVEETVLDERTGEIHARTAGRRTGSRIDPLGVLRKVPVYKGASGWSTDPSAAGKGAKKVRPSEINHSNIAPSITPLGVTCEYLEHRTVITLAGIRRLRFGGGRRDLSGQVLVASLGLLGIAEQDLRGYALRSRCDLVCESNAPLELVHWDGTTTEIEFDLSSARSLYRDAYQRAEQIGFDFRSIVLSPQDKLVDIIRQSRELALEGEGGDGESDR